MEGNNNSFCAFAEIVPNHSVELYMLQKYHRDRKIYLEILMENVPVRVIGIITTEGHTVFTLVQDKVFFQVCHQRERER